MFAIKCRLMTHCAVAGLSLALVLATTAEARSGDETPEEMANATTESRGLFALEGYSLDASVRIINTSHLYAVETAYSAFPDDEVSLIDTTPPPLPEGVKVLTVKEPGLGRRYQDPLYRDGTIFTVPSPNTRALGEGIQGKIYAEHEATGALKGMVISFAPTNAPIDITDYPDLIDGDLIAACEPVLLAAREYARARGLDGGDFMVTGYSLGGGLAASMIKHSSSLADDFFADAMYVSHDGPIAFDFRSYDSRGRENFFAYGYENDVVYRYTGENESIRVVLAEIEGPGKSNQDLEFESSADNVVLFTDIFAEKGEDFSMGLASPESWFTHILGTTPGLTERIGQSAFYQLMDRDSAVVISLLSEDQVPEYWLEDIQSADSEDLGRDAFLIGGELNDRIRGGAGHDSIEGGDGDDTFLVGEGLDRLYGGAGKDAFIFSSMDDKSDVIYDFTLEGDDVDVLDVSEIVINFNSMANDIDDYLILEVRGNGSAELLVNPSGSGNPSDFEILVKLYGSDFSGYDVSDLINRRILLVY